MRHAAPEEIVAFRDGEPIDDETGRHIGACPLCRRQLGEARWVRTHTRSRVFEPHGPEPTKDEIAAYLDEALDEREMARVETHIRSSDRCLAVFDRLLQMALKLKDPIPGPEHLESLKAKLRGPRLLGRLRIFVKGSFQQVFKPARPGQPAFGRSMMAMEVAAAPPMPRDIHDVECCQAPGDDLFSLSEELASKRIEPPVPPPPPRPSRPRVINAGRWLIRTVTSGTAGKTELELVIEDVKSGDPVPGVPVKLVPGWDDPVDARTSENGSVRFPLPDGDSSLEIGEGPELVLDIDANLDAEKS